MSPEGVDILESASDQCGVDSSESEQMSLYITHDRFTSLCLTEFLSIAQTLPDRTDPSIP